MEPLNRSQTIRIVNNVAKVIKTGNIELLSKQAYNYLYLCSGFIAHYNWAGFKDYYADTATLKADILANEESNKWRNFRPGEKDYEYYHAKALCYDAIIRAIENVKPQHRAPIGECA